jgi:large subunit ribosomal protein L17
MRRNPAKRGVKASEPKGRTLAARRLVMTEIVNEDVVTKLFDQLAPRFMDRPGGYTRIMRLGHRRGDAAEIAQIELLGSEYDPKKAEAEKAEQEGAAEGPKQKSVGERLRSAAQNIRGKKESKAEAPRAKASKPARGAAKQTSTPRKAGGS